MLREVAAHELGLGEGRLRQVDLFRPIRGVRQAGSDRDKGALAWLAAATELVLPPGSLNPDLDDFIVLGDAVVHHRRGISQ